MQTLNLQAPKTAELDVSPKSKGTQAAKKTPSKNPNQPKMASFKEMVDQSVKDEGGATTKATQSPATAREASLQQRDNSKARPTDELQDEGTQVAVAFAQGNSIETSWLQNALEGQDTQKKAASNLADPIDDQEIAFLKTDPLLDEGFPLSVAGANLSSAQASPTAVGDQAEVYTDGAHQRLADELLSAETKDVLTVKDNESSSPLRQESNVETALFTANGADGKEKGKVRMSSIRQQADSLQPLSELPLAAQKLADIAVPSGDAENSPEMVAAQNELLGGVFTVTDLRPATQKDVRTGDALEAGKAQTADGRSELTLELSLPQTAHTTEHVAAKETTGTPSFQRLLSEQLRSGAPDFVKAGSIVLRGENEGTIKLSLRPESLGNVKINLQLSDNVITGKIAVASKEAFEAFKQNIDALRQAFSDSGFEGAEFTLSYFDSSSGFAQESGGQNDGRFLSNRAYADYVSDEGISGDAGESQILALDTDKKVNVVA